MHAIMDKSPCEDTDGSCARLYGFEGLNLSFHDSIMLMTHLKRDSLSDLKTRCQQVHKRPSNQIMSTP